MRSSVLGALAEEQDDTRIVAVPWPMFEKFFSDSWQPGQHIAMIGPTGEGKTTFAVGILKNRKWVLALDPKGEDDTLKASGFRRITDWPLDSKTRDSIAEGNPARLIVGGAMRTDKDLAAMAKLMQDVIKGVRAEGGWTLYADEFQLLADQRMDFKLGRQVEAMLVSARSRGTSVVTSFQATAWVPKAATRQASWVVLWPTRDINVIKSVAESMGRDWKELVAAVHELPKYHVLVIPKSVHAPVILTKAPKIN